MAYNSKFILANGINLDKNHLNVLDYSEASMVTLCQSKAVYQGNDFQFIRDNGRISIRATYAQAVTANYIAFQNPDYANKWFFAFIDQVIYKSDSVVEIDYTVDLWATWYSYWSYLECYVLREHAANDTVGANIVPEDFSVDEMDMILFSNQSINAANSLVYCVGVNASTTGMGESSFGGGGVYGGIPCGYRIFAFTSIAALKDMLKLYEDEPEKVVCVFLCPREFFNANDKIYDSAEGGYIPIDDNDGFSFDTPVSPITPTFEGYTPRNNKLYVYPYTYYKLVNNLGAGAVFKRESFDGVPNFRTVGSNAATGSIITFPTNYKKNSGAAVPLENNIAINALPSGGWQGDAIAQWQANNGISTSVQTATTIGGTIASAAMMAVPGLQIPGAIGLSGSIAGAANTIGNLANTSSKLEHAANPIVGGSNNISGLMALGTDALKPRLETYCVNGQIARVIDDYFTKYGYATKQIKVPNVSGHYNQNYVQVQGAAVKGDLPGRVCDEINSLFNRGIHIWHSHDAIGNF